MTVRRALVAAAVVAAMACALPGCAGTDDRPVSSAPVGDERVGLTEWDVTTQRLPLRPGEARLHVTNAGAAEHDLAVRGGLGTWKTRRLRPGEQATLVVHGKPGERLRLWCTVEGHVAAGMTTSLVVARR